MSNTIILHDSYSQAVITMVKAQINNDRKRYDAYVAAHGVTPENIAEHVKALREAAFPGVKADGRAEQGTKERKAKQFADKVRLGLRTAVGDSPEVRAAAATDWIKKIVTDVQAGRDKGNLTVEQIMEAVEVALGEADAADES